MPFDKEPRTISSEESAILHAVVAHSQRPIAPWFVDVIETLEVHYNCECGCPSITISLPAHASDDGSGANDWVIDLQGRNARGTLMIVLGFVRGGGIAALEMLQIPTDEEDGSLPLPETVGPSTGHVINTL